MGTPGAAALLVLRCAVIRFPEPEIHLSPGTDMNLAVTFPAGSIPSYPIHPAMPVSPSLAEQLATISRETTRRNGKPADDIINVIFVGSSKGFGRFCSSRWDGQKLSNAPPVHSPANTRHSPP